MFRGNWSLNWPHLKENDLVSTNNWKKLSDSENRRKLRDSALALSDQMHDVHKNICFRKTHIRNQKKEFVYNLDIAKQYYHILGMIPRHLWNLWSYKMVMVEYENFTSMIEKL